MQKNVNRILLIIITCLIAMLGYKAIKRHYYKPSVVINKTISTEVVPGGTTVGTNREEVESIIKDYLLNNPEIIITSIENFHRQKNEQILEKSQEDLNEKNLDLKSGGNSPILGNATGEFIIVVFYDYNCSYCKKGDAVIENLTDKYGNLKVILKPFPILGEDSVYLAKLTLSINKVFPEKFKTVHRGLMTLERPNKEQVTKLLEENSIDIKFIEQEMDKPEIIGLINKNIELASSLGLRGAPAYIVNGKLISGLIKQEAFERMIEEAATEAAK